VFTIASAYHHAVSSVRRFGGDLEEHMKNSPQRAMSIGTNDRITVGYVATFRGTKSVNKPFKDTRPNNRSLYGRGIQISKGRFRVRFGRPPVEVGTYDALEDAQHMSGLIVAELNKGRPLRQVVEELRDAKPRHTHTPRPFVNRKGAPITTALPGQVFGTLVVVGEALKRAPERRLVLVRCKCGAEKFVGAGALVAGATRSCGATECTTRATTQRQRYGYTTPGNQARNFIYHNYRSTARKRGRTFDITKEDFHDLTSQECHYCGQPLSNRTKDRNGDGFFVYNGLDRVDSSRGYTLDNVVPACIVCNKAKTDMSCDDFLAWVRRVAAHTEGR
jgi:hypothetical protein